MFCLRLATYFLLTLPALSQPLTNLAVPPMQPPGKAFLRFDLSGDEAGPNARFATGEASVTGRLRGGAVVTHRYFYDATHIYFGYDIVVQPDHDDFFQETFYDLSITPLDFEAALADSLDLPTWKKFPISALPPARLVHAGDITEIGVYVDLATGKSYTDSVTVVSSADILRQMKTQLQRATAQRAGQLSALADTVPQRAIPTISGPSRDFSAADAELRLQAPQITINDESVNPPLRNAAVGTLVWAYIPGHGRFILSLVPRSDLGFVRAGELRGGVATFTVGKDKVRIEAPITIALGDSAYTLYVLPQPDWAPASPSQVSSVHIGSIFPRELALLKK